MSYETARSSPSRSLRRPALPSFLHLIAPQENIDSNRPEGSKFTIKSFSRVFHHIVFGTVSRLERVTEATIEDENAAYNARATNSTKCRPASHPASRPSTSSIVSQSTASHISTPRSPKTLITSFPPLNASDIPPRSPTNKSPFSAVLLAGEGEEREEDDPALVLWRTEQLHRARREKLTRHLGEEIPAEMVLSPAFLSHSRRGYCHKRASLDPSSFLRESSSTEGVLRRSISLKERGLAHRTFLMTGVTPKIPSTECVGGVRSAETTTNMVPIPNTAPTSSTSPESCDSNSPMNIPDGGVLRERVSADTYSDSLLSRSSRPSAEASRKASPFSLHMPRAPPKPRVLPRRPATADASRRVEKLADFFGVHHDDVARAHRIAQELKISSTSAAGDLAIGIHAPKSQLEVEVKVSKPTRFWNGRASTKSIHPDDVMDQLRMMRAS